MPLCPALDGVRAKIARAQEHFETVNTSIVSVLGTKEKHPVPTYDYDPNSQELVVRMKKTTPLDQVVPLAMGDCIHNARSSLDHLVVQLAILHNTALSAASSTFFPVCLTASDFKKSVERRVAPFVSTAALAEIEKLQPYSLGNAHREDILYVLAQLDNIDKHRLLIVTASKFMPTGFCVTLPAGDQFRHEITHEEALQWKTAKDGAEIIRFDLSEVITEPGRVNVKLDTVSTAHIERTGLICDGYAVQFILRDCIQYVATVVDDFGRKFFSE